MIKNQILLVLFVLIAYVANSQIVPLEKDKQLHFLAGTLTSAVGYHYVYNKTHDKTKATLAGIGCAILAGTIKETIDSRKPGNKFDPQDLAATTLGGITISVTINLFNKKKKNVRRKM